MQQRVEEGKHSRIFDGHMPIMSVKCSTMEKDEKIKKITADCRIKKKKNRYVKEEIS